MDTAQKLAGRLNLLLEEHFLKLVEADEEHMDFAPPDGSWSGKQVMGHLIDSAANNHGRIVRGMSGGDFVFPGYDQDAWVSNQRYVDRTWRDVINLWHDYNKHIVHVVVNIPEEVLHRRHKVHNLHEIAFRPFNKHKAATLFDLVEDYIEHLRHHLERL